MSVLIKGMEMPTHCTECDFWHDGVFEHCLLNMEIQNEDVPLDEGEYPNACPLVEIPPHGRLIDADALMRSLGITNMECDKCGWYDDKWGRCMRGSDFEDSCCAIEDAPTIIEAEEGKT